jgi:glycosyltransferase involved in cell wall biosynthesis
MSFSDCKIIIVTPVYEDSEASAMLFRELAQLANHAIFIVAVDDGSVNNVLDIAAISDAKLDGAVLRLKRNVGHQKAIAIGISYVAEHISAGQMVVLMDSDGEDLPSSIPKLIAELRRTEVDVVVAKRKNRVETIQFKVFYFFYKKFFRLLTGREISFGNFMLLQASAVKRIAAMHELSTHVAATILLSKLRISKLPIDRGARYAGRSKMNFVGLVLHGFKGLMIFAEDVLVRVGLGATLLSALTITCATIAIGLKLTGFSTPGWFSVALGILILMLLQTGTIALIALMLMGVTRTNITPSYSTYKNYIENINLTLKNL